MKCVLLVVLALQALGVVKALKIDRSASPAHVPTNRSHLLVHVHKRRKRRTTAKSPEGRCMFCSEMTNACQNMHDDCADCPICQGIPKAPVIQYISREYNSGMRLVIGNADEFVTRIKSGADGSGVCSKNLSVLQYRNSETCASSRYHNIGFQITAEFNEKVGSNWHFDFGVDFGLGGVIYVDGEKVKSYGGDVWWARNDDHANHLGFGYFFPKGRHKLELYGAEGCCDGWSRVKFCANCETPSDMELLSIENLNRASEHNVEVGTFDLDPDDWGAQVHFQLVFANTPVVVLLSNGQSTTPVSARLMEVTQSGFFAFLATPDQPSLIQAKKAGPMKVVYMAMEKGVHMLPDGRTVEAGLVDDVGMTKTSESITFEHAFGTKPALVSLLQTANEFSFCRVVTQGLTKEEASLSLEAPAGFSNGNGFKMDEQVGWIAFEQGYGTFPTRNQSLSYSAKVTAIDCGSSTVAFQNGFNATNPIVLGSRIAPADGGWIVLESVTTSGAEVVTTDAQSCVAESNFVSLVAFSGGFFA